MKRKHRIFIGLREVAGYFGNLKAGFDAIGEDAVFMNLGGNRFDYPEGKNPAWVRFFNAVGRRFGKHFSRNFTLRLLWLVFFQNFFSLLALHIAVFRCNTFIMGSNSTFFFFAELPLLKLLRKKIIYVFMGSDSRPVYLNGYVMTGGKKPGRAALLCFFQKITIRIIERFADHIIDHPPQSQLHRKKFISFLCLGIPVDESRIPAPGDEKQSPKVRILHAPSKSGPKGSDFFRGLIDELKSKQYPIEYIEITGLSNAQVLQKISECDFIVDERYSDTPMAVFAAEAAICGKAALVGSYYSEQILNDVPGPYIPHSVFCHPDKIREELENLITNREYCRKLGSDAQAFVQTNWNCRKLAEKYLAIFRDEVPKEWYFDPLKLRYLHGCGLSEKDAGRNIATILKLCGKRCLQMKHNPGLEQELINFAKKHEDQ